MNKDVVQGLIISLFQSLKVCKQNSPPLKLLMPGTFEMPHLYKHLSLLSSIPISTSGKGKGANELQMRMPEVPEMTVGSFVFVMFHARWWILSY